MSQARIINLQYAGESTLLAQGQQQEGLSIHPTTPNALERDMASPNIGPFGWIGIALCIILVVIAGTSIFNAAKKAGAKKLVDGPEHSGAAETATK